MNSQVATAVAGKWTLLGNPKQAAAKPMITGMAKGDTIQFPTERLMLNVYTYNGEKWAYWDEANPVVTDAPKVPAGLGFWYVSVSTGESSVKVEW